MIMYTHTDWTDERLAERIDGFWYLSLTKYSTFLRNVWTVARMCSVVLKVSAWTSRWFMSRSLPSSWIYSLVFYNSMRRHRFVFTSEFVCFNKLKIIKLARTTFYLQSYHVFSFIIETVISKWNITHFIIRLYVWMATQQYFIIPLYNSDEKL